MSDETKKMIVEEFVNEVLKIEKDALKDLETSSTSKKINDKIEKAFEEVYSKYENKQD